MLEKKREYHLGKGEMLEFRVWTSSVNSVMQGLIHNSDAQAQPTTVDAFLALYRFATDRDEENLGSGFSPLHFACVR